MRSQDFNQLVKVLMGKKPDRPVLFDFILDFEHCKTISGYSGELSTNRHILEMYLQAQIKLGFDFFSVPQWHTDTLQFKTAQHASKESKSLNEGVITTESDFETYPWPDPSSYDYSVYDSIAKKLPDGMKMVAMGPGGVLEIVIDLVGYENLCIMSMMQPELCKAVFDKVGSILLEYYDIISGIEMVGTCMGNDDWGFKTQTMLSPDQMREYVIPWHKKIVETIHSHGKPAILHSCGNLKAVMNDVIDIIGYDGKHSWEDNIMPVEEAYDTYGDRIAVIGGIDVDFLARSTPEEVYSRAVNMLEKTADTGGYALGAGNSLTKYIPLENYMQLVRAAEDFATV